MRTALFVGSCVLAGCTTHTEPPPREPPGAGEAAAPTDATAMRAAAPSPAHDAIARMDFNRFAVRLNLPVYWIADANGDGRIDPPETASLLFYGGAPVWTEGGAFTRAFEAAYAQIVAASKAPAIDDTTEDGKRRALVRRDLDAGRATLVRSDFRGATAADKAFVRRMLAVADRIDALYETQSGTAAWTARLPADPESRSLFRRNRGPKCEAPVTGDDPACSAIAGAPKPTVDVYPAAAQAKPGFCKDLEARRDADALLAPFVVVRDDYRAVPYSEAYRAQVTAISALLVAAAHDITDPAEKPLVDYLTAAAASFVSNDWHPADEAWARMSVDNSRWYVRVAPDETYWEPCAHKAGFHLTLARINQGSKAWQAKLLPVQQEMEEAIAALASPAYKSHKVTFHLPDFIDIVVNAGDDRGPLGATIGQSLPNWGPVANEGRGRTVAMVNINTDPDSRAARKAQAESLLDAASAKLVPASTEPALLSTILHEATHNLGPAHEYAVRGKKDDAAFGGPIAAMLEELKAQTGALFLLDFLRKKQLISDELATASFVDSLVWAFGHISQGMYTGDGNRKAYSNLAAIQVGVLMEAGALRWNAEALAANGTDRGAFTIDVPKLAPVARQLMQQVVRIKARGDKAAAEKLIARYVDAATVVPHRVIAERLLRYPKSSFVYSVDL